MSSALEGMLLEKRLLLAETLRGLKALVAHEVTEEFLLRHPDWLERYGERARTHGRQDATYHMEYLAGAVAGGSVVAFEEYSRWTARVLASRNIAGEFLKESFRQLEASLVTRLEPSDGALIGRLIEAGCSASGGPQQPLDLESNVHRLSDARGVYLQALLAGGRQQAVQVALEALGDGHSVEDIYVELLQESQYAIGRLWESNQITVAQEHIATAITQFTLAHLYPHIALASVPRGKAIVTGVEGEMHQLGSNMVADVLESVGWDVRFLGTNLPQSGIVEIVREFQPEFLGISATMLFNVGKVASLVAAVQAIPDLSPPNIILGGAAFRHTPNLFVEMGAQGQASDLRSILALQRLWSSSS